MTDTIRLDISGAPEVHLASGPAVGDVYRINAVRSGPRFAVVVAISGETAYELKFNADGIPCGVGQSGLHYLERKGRIGRVANLPLLEVEWD